MNKDKEKKGVDDLVKYLGEWSIVLPSRESPDFILKNSSSNELVGVEVTDYYPHRTHIGHAEVKFPGSEHKFFVQSGSDKSYFRMVPPMDVKNFQEACIYKKEKKLESYKRNAPDCKEFWLLVMLEFNDNVIYRNIGSLHSSFDRVFIWEEPHQISELSLEK